MIDWIEIVNGSPMPPLDHEVLIWTGGAKRPTMFTAQRRKFENGHCGWYLNGEDDEHIGFHRVTHWGELPTPPIKETK